ncbi:thiolase [Pigmentiphaga soli]|uniref:Thiolase n=1 Tax=Pigmentiphaga soli TaxID=1007095 RepID=A0ABP8HH37_9BURK
MTDSLRGAAAIVGVATAGLGEAPGRSSLELLGEAARLALADAGLGIRDVDGLFANTAVHSHPALSVGEYLGVRPAFSESSSIGGASFVGYALTAAMALQAGLCKVALICYGSNQRTESGRLRAKSGSQDYETPYRPRHPISSFALATARHMHQYGTTREQLAEVAVAARRWAGLNPEAFMREPLSIGDVLGARMVSDPITVRDCCLVTDGAGAVVMTRADRARDLRRRPAYLLGAGMAHWHMQVDQMADMTVTAASESGPRAFAMAGLSPSDVDVAQIYDAFTINIVLALEDLGFCAKGEGGAFVQDGRIAPGGALPVNTNGGGLSCCHPGMYGIFTLIEATRQLRGEAGARQVEGARVALCHGNGGRLASQVTALIGTER